MNSEYNRNLLYQCLGDLPPIDRPISAETIYIKENDIYSLEYLLLDLNGYENVPAYFVTPMDSCGPYPTVIYNHAHGGDYLSGKNELVRGIPCLQNPPYAEQLAKMGYASICIDHWCFGERSGRRESEIFKEMLWYGRSMWGMMVYDSMRTVDYLESRSDTDMERIGTLGLSMGSTMAWWLSALDTRIKVCVDMCCMTDYHSLIDARGLDGHGIYYYVPGLLKHFTTSGINALIAPRAHLSLNGNYDLLTPPAGLDKIDADLRKIYAEMNASENWSMVRYDTGHFECADMRSRIVNFLKEQL